MQLTPYLIFLLLLLGVGTTLIAIANMFFYTILGEVNATLPQNQQVGMMGVNLKYGRVLGMHTERFPDSKKRHRMKLFGVAGFLFIGVAFLLDVMHYGHW
jgi:hypothetical protein